ncbi:MAG: response regulator [Anaerolineae bacterium]
MTPSSFQRSRDTAQPSILVVEDETIIGLDLRERLTDYGYYVTQVVAAGAEAVEAALVNRPRLVLMDIRLKGPMDGITAAERIREAADIPIVFLTAYVDEDTLLRAHDVSPYGYVLKPFKSEQLLGRLHLNQHQG